MPDLAALGASESGVGGTTGRANGVAEGSVCGPERDSGVGVSLLVSSARAALVTLGVGSVPE